MKTLSAILSLLLLACLCGCANKQTDVDNMSKEDLSAISEKLDTIIDLVNSGSVGTGAESIPVQNFPEADDTVSSDSENTTAASSSDSKENTTSKSSSSSSTTKKAANSVPTTIAEIVEYYNKSANQVKVDKPGFTCKETPSVGQIDCNTAGTLVNIIKEAAMGLVKPSSFSANKGEEHNRFVVENQTWSSKLEPSAVKTATCKKVGEFYQIHILLKDEQLGNLPDSVEHTNHGKAIHIMSRPEIDQILSGIPLLEIKKFAPLYTGCYIDCTINIATGKMHTATFNMNNIVDIEANSIIAKVPYAIKKEFTLNY